MTNFGTGHLQKIVIFNLLLKLSFAKSFGNLGIFARSNSLNANRHLARSVTFEAVICEVLLYLSTNLSHTVDEKVGIGMNQDFLHIVNFGQFNGFCNSLNFRSIICITVHLFTLVEFVIFRKVLFSQIKRFLHFFFCRILKNLQHYLHF